MLLHGYADHPSELYALADELDPDDAYLVLAPTGPVTTPGGPAWFASAPTDAGPGLPETLDALTDWLDDTAARHDIDPSAVDVLGYSQGAAAALALAFRAGARWRPASVVGHAAWLANEPGIEWDFRRSTGVRALLTHGIDDEVVPVQQGRSAAKVLEREGLAVELAELEAGHELSALPVAHIARWLRTT